MSYRKSVGNLLRTILRYIPMPIFAAIVGLLAGWALWVVVDSIQTGAVRRIYQEQLNSILEQRAREELINFDHSVNSYDTTVRLLANHRRLSNYLDPVYWFPDDQEPPIIYRENPPIWLPEPERWETLVTPSHILLLDTTGRVREEYVVQGEPLSDELIQQAPGFSTRSQAFLTALNEKPFLLTSTLVEDAAYNIMGSLMLVVPIDNRFLVAAQRGVSTDGAITAVVDLDEQLILSSSDIDSIASGIPVGIAEKSYAVTFQSFFDYEGANLNLQFATFVPRAGVQEMSRRIVKLERRQRLILALSFVAFFSLLFMVVSNRLSRSLKRLSAFSQRALGISQPVDQSGNQLLILEDWMKRFINLVREAREETRVRHESEIREKEALTSAIMKASIDSIVTVDEGGNIIDFNPTAEKAFGYSAFDVEKRIAAEQLISEENRSYFSALLQACRESGEQLRDARAEFSALRSDGSIFPVELAIQPIVMDGSELFTLYFHDISERRRQEREIRALAAFPSESPTPILRVNRLGVVTYANDASQPLLEFWQCSQMQTLPLNWRLKVELTLESGEDQETEIDTGERFYSLLLAPIPELEYVNIYARDITETRSAEEEARRHQTELVHVCRLSSMGEMATGLAHELNQPLSAIINYANGAKRRFKNGATGEELEEPLTHISAQAKRAAQIIKWLRGLVARQAPVRTAVDANEMVHEVLSFMDFEIRKSGVEIDLDLADKLPRIQIDLVQVEQVLLNLLRNAIDAVTEAGIEKSQILVTTSSRDEALVVTVEDNGPGLSDEAKNHVFEPFYSTKSTGMGMGLSISQTILEDHQGRIELSSGTLGGASFSMVFPQLDTLLEKQQTREREVTT